MKKSSRSIKWLVIFGGESLLVKKKKFTNFSKLSSEMFVTGNHNIQVVGYEKGISKIYRQKNKIR